eukprot:131242-Pleurochrysis_carterae.AAC.1
MEWPKPADVGSAYCFHCVFDFGHAPAASGSRAAPPKCGRKRRKEYQPESSDKSVASAPSSDPSDEDLPANVEALEEDCDPLPHIPSGRVKLEWDGHRSSISECMYWASIDGAVPAWHKGKVSR